MALDGLGISLNNFLAWAIAVLGISLVAFLYVCRWENSMSSRLLWLLLLIAVPVLAPVAAILYFWLLQPALQNRKQKAA